MAETPIPYPTQLARGVQKTALPTTFDLFAGSADIVSDQVDVGATALKIFQVYHKGDDGKAVPYVAATHGVGGAHGIAAQALAANTTGPAFVGGDFNHEAATWDAADTALAVRKAAFAGTNMNVKKLL
jgi:hypothetical protein